MVTFSVVGQFHHWKTKLTLIRKPISEKKSSLIDIMVCRELVGEVNLPLMGQSLCMIACVAFVAISGLLNIYIRKTPSLFGRHGRQTPINSKCLV